MEETEPATAADPKKAKEATRSDDPAADAAYPDSPDRMSEAPPSGAEDRPGDDAEPDPTVPREQEASGDGSDDAGDEPDGGHEAASDKPEVQPEEPGSMLGIAPRAEAIVSEREMSPQEKAILQDLEESMDPEDRDHGEEHGDEPAAGTEGVATGAEDPESASMKEAKVASGNLAAPVAMAAAETKPKKKSILPWWAAVLLYGGAGAFAIYTGVEETRQVMKILFVGLGLYLLYGAYEAVRDRNKGKNQPKGETPPQSPPESPPASP